ncbi:MAG: LacI family DNA-binding transcriptional regulator [Planctomycetota bacterium]
MTQRSGNISVRQLASRLGVSTATVSRALNNHPSVAPETRARVLELADATGYMPRVGQRHSTNVGLVYPSHPVAPEFGSFESALLSGIMRGLAEHRYDLSLIEVDRDRSADESYTQFFRRKGVRGVIVRTIGPDASLGEAIAAEGYPSIIVADRSDVPGVNYICSDSMRDSQRAVDHLVQLGHRRIALVVHTLLDTDHRDRMRGYKASLASHGIEVDPMLVIQQPAGMDGGRRALAQMRELLDPPTAVFCTNPLTTVGLLHSCLELGVSVPDELSVVGFDDSDTRFHTFPQYTAVCQEAGQFGYEAARWLTRSLEGIESAAMRSSRPTTLNIHRTTGPVPVMHWAEARLTGGRKTQMIEPRTATAGRGVSAGLSPAPMGTGVAAPGNRETGE